MNFSIVKKKNTVNQLSALKTNYYQWIILIKIQIANDNLLLLEYMIKYGNTLSSQHGQTTHVLLGRNQYSGLESMLVMMQNNIAQKRIVQQLDVR
jgi:hypothetical protein